MPTDDTSSTTVKSHTPTSPSMTLPAEIRTKIYKMSLHDNIMTILSARYFRTTTTLRPQYLGALAFLHTSRAIRAEFAREMIPLVQAWCQSLEGHSKRVLAAPLAEEFGYGLDVKRAEDQINYAERRAHAMGNVKSVLWRVVLSWPLVD